MMLPPIEAMLRSWPDAANSNASAITGKRRRTLWSAARQRLDPAHVGQAVDVQETLGMRRPVLDEAKEIGPTGDEGELRIDGVGRDRLRGIVGSRQRERMHGSASPRGLR